MKRKKIKVLFVCMGNICRSPTAEGIFRSLVEREGLENFIEIDSAGTHGHYHDGQAPDKRSQNAAIKRGYDLSSLRARAIEPKDYKDFDYILAMDEANFQNMIEICPESDQDKLKLMLDYSDSYVGGDVPDPYQGGSEGFELVLDMLEEATMGLLNEIKKDLK